MSSTEYMVSQHLDQEILNSDILGDELEQKNTFSRINKQELSQLINFESAVLALMKLLKKYENDINIKDSTLTIKSFDVLERVNFLMEFLCNIPFSFDCNQEQTDFCYNFTHLDEEIQNILQVDLK